MMTLDLELDDKTAKFLTRNYTKEEINTLVTDIILKIKRLTDSYKRGEISIKELARELKLSEDKALEFALV